VDGASSLEDKDERYMRRAIALGMQAKGKTGDNPYVGCVIVAGDEILGEGFTQPPGLPHAEIGALLAAERQGHEVAGATLYTTLEPCTFFGRTPPCAQAILERRLARVVVGICDPHPRVNGKGIELLREAGIELRLGVCEEEVSRYLADWLVEFYPGHRRR
jgi:diaminohydroxyphosphoribosylaminopyrimidine deaminase / 5-amino-6-(5-phosphoribosylamino)uracil reductase